MNEKIEFNLLPAQRKRLTYLAGGSKESDIEAWVVKHIFREIMSLPEARTCHKCLADHPPMMLPGHTENNIHFITGNTPPGSTLVPVVTCRECGNSAMTAEADPALNPEVRAEAEARVEQSCSELEKVFSGAAVETE